ncbi:hypothetical protein CEXT_347951 [Caerostris extrusa]|uniref:Secreted protein n=1 Tax=Caerostris extrusa TaxID=172846 RepID=A0AAV4S1B4_CAEEX|nr:hypothetical protein CEXT_347951 [Caerostris extrusa]
MPDERRVPLLRDRRNKNTSNRSSGLMQQHRRVLILLLSRWCCSAVRVPCISVLPLIRPRKRRPNSCVHVRHTHSSSTENGTAEFTLSFYLLERCQME